MLFFHKKKTPHQGACMVLHLVVAGLLLFASIAAFVGVYKAHVLDAGLVFGSSSGSLSLLAFAVCLTLWMQQMRNCATPCDVCVAPPTGKKK